MVSQASKVGIVTCPGVETPVRPTQLTHNRYQVSYVGVKWLGHGNDQPFATSAKVKDRVELYLHPLCFHSM